MFHPDVAAQLRAAGHDALHVGEIGMNGTEDADILTRAASDDLVIVTENAVDFVPLLDVRTATGLATPPVVIALKRTLPRTAGAMTHHLAKRLTNWATANPTPYRHVHWVGTEFD
jgi:predicted nuclease of predicted toxin-antitoxin system